MELINSLTTPKLLSRTSFVPKNFKKTKLAFGSHITLSGIKCENINLDYVESTVSFLCKYLLTDGDFYQTFGSISKRPVCGLLEQIKKNELLRDIQKTNFSGKLNDELIKSVVKIALFEKYLNTRDSTYFLAVIEPDKDTIQNIRWLISRAVQYIRDCLKDSINDFYFLTTKKNFLIAKDRLIYFKVDSQNLLKDVDVQEIWNYYLEGLSNSFSKFQAIEKLVIFNPRLNIEYSLKFSDFFE